jgi:hypothetical protein
MNTATRFASASCLKADLPTMALLALCVLASAGEAALTRARSITQTYQRSP